MRSRTPVVRRCTAVAAHGKRCRQTPFKTSPFCWHHTARADRDALRGADLRSEDRAKVSADRIVRMLTDRDLVQLEQFLSAGDEGTIRLEKRSGRLTAQQERAAH